MKVVQSKLQECLDKGNMNSFERLSTVLATSEDEIETGNEPEPMEPLPPVVEPPAKGENKVPTKRRREQKYRLKKKPREGQKEKRKPRYFCSF